MLQCSNIGVGAGSARDCPFVQLILVGLLVQRGLRGSNNERIDCALGLTYWDVQDNLNAPAAENGSIELIFGTTLDF